MSSAELVDMDEGRFELRGVLDFSTVGALLSSGLEVFTGHAEVVLDLERVTRANSAGLVLLLEWLDHGRQRGYKLRVINLPDSLLAISRISNVDAMLAPGRAGA